MVRMVAAALMLVAGTLAAWQESDKDVYGVWFLGNERVREAAVYEDRDAYYVVVLKDDFLSDNLIRVAEIERIEPERVRITKGYLRYMERMIVAYLLEDESVEESAIERQCLGIIVTNGEARLTNDCD